MTESYISSTQLLPFQAIPQPFPRILCSHNPTNPPSARLATVPFSHLNPNPGFNFSVALIQTTLVSPTNAVLGHTSILSNTNPLQLSSVLHSTITLSVCLRIWQANIIPTRIRHTCRVPWIHIINRAGEIRPCEVLHPDSRVIRALCSSSRL